MNEYALTLDLAKAKQRQQQTIFVRQGDRNATTIVATITDHGVAASTAGMAARFAMRLPNGTEYYRKTATLSGNTATVTIDEAQAASAVGRTDVAYFQLLQGSTVVASTESFTVIVLPDALADAEVPESYDSAIQDAIDALDEAVEQLPSTVEDVLADHPEWTTTVTDGSITKAKLATDLALDRERMLYRLDNLLTNALPEGDVATATDAAQTPVAGLALYGRSAQDGTPTPSAPVPIVSVAPDSQGNISLWARGRNLLDTKANVMKETNRNGSWSDNAWTLNGVTFTVNPFGSITVNGTASGLTTMLLTRNGFALPAGTYVLSGCPSGGSDNTYRIDIYAVEGVALAVDYGSGAQFTLTERTVISYVRIRVPSGASLSNKTFCPMIRPVGLSPEFQPYTESITALPTDGHTLRSLPDGTRDEVTVDQYGHVTLVQRVGHIELDGSSDEDWAAINKSFAVAAPNVKIAQTSAQVMQARSNRFVPASANDTWTGRSVGVSIANTTDRPLRFHNGDMTLAEWKTWLAANHVTVDYPLATPQTIDLGTIDSVPLVGPDLTAQAIPSAPFALTYERDLNATLARLESAIATLA